jgi:hypothetical protein
MRVSEFMQQALKNNLLGLILNLLTDTLLTALAMLCKMRI